MGSCSRDDAGFTGSPTSPSGPVGALTVSPSSSTLGWLGETRQLTAQMTTAAGANPQGLTYLWRSLDPGVVTVTENGLVTAVSEGSATIRVRVLDLTTDATVVVKRVPAILVLSPDTVLFLELGITQAIHASVTDGGGVPFASAAVTWTSSDTTVATVDASGTITSVRQGRATVTASAGDVVGAVGVRVAVGAATIDVTPAAVEIDALGDSIQLSAVVKNAAGETIEGFVATYAITDTTVATVDASGVVSARGVGTAVLTVRADSLSRQLAVSVRQTPASIVLAPDTVTLVPGTTSALSASVSDRNGNPAPGAVVTWASTDPSVVSVSSTGQMTGGSPGVATVIATAGAVSDSALVTVLDVPAFTVVVLPETLALEVGERARLSVRFYSELNVELTGSTATWSSSDTDVAVASASGVVTAVGAGSAWIKATSTDSLAAADSSEVTVTAVAGAFDIEVRYVGPAPTASQQSAFAAAEARWEEVVLGDLDDLTLSVDAGACGIDHEAINETIDDLIIFAQVDSIDGPSGILGQAAPCFVRNTDGLTIMGIMQFDEADLDQLEAAGELGDVILHEMGHVLGFGVSTPWNETLVGAGSEDPYWPGTLAVTEYDLAGGLAVNRVPVANTGGSGTRDAHWREADMGAELMTGFLDAGVTRPLSAISIGALQDMGYVVDITAADTYSVSGALRANPARVVELRELRPAPPRRVTASGEILPSLRQ